MRDLRKRPRDGEHKLEVSETYIDETRGCIFGDSGGWYEPYTENVGRLFRNMQQEFGRCTGTVYVDTAQGETMATGWVFSKRVEYDDAHRIRRKEDRTYVREVWVSLRWTPVTEGKD